MTAPDCCRDKMDRTAPDMHADVREFHEAMCPDQMGPVPTPLSPAMIELRRALIEEEVGEMLDALAVNDLPKLADGAADTIYVVIGTLIAAGIDIRPVWNAVQAANMAKRDGPIREDGKRLKPEGWMPPDVEGVLRAQGMECERESCPSCARD